MPSRFPGTISQDLEPVVLRKSRPKPSELRDPKAVNSALRAGVPVKTVKKFNAGSNKNASSATPVVSVKKLDEVTEPAAREGLPLERRQVIQRARVAKEMSQAELAKQINERLEVVQKYESGKAVPNPAVLAKIEKILGIKLRGKHTTNNTK